MKTVILLEDLNQLNLVKSEYPHFTYLGLTENNISEILTTITTPSLLNPNEQYLIVDEDNLFKTSDQNLVMFLKNLNNHLLVTTKLHEDYKLAFTDLMTKETNISPNNIIEDTIKEHGITITPKDLELLSFNLDGDFLAINNELKKLSLLSPVITTEMINNYSYKTSQASAFFLIDLILEQNFLKAFEYGEVLLEQNFTAMSLLIFVEKQIAFCYKLKVMNSLYKKNTTMTKLKLSEWRYEELSKKIENISFCELSSIINQLAIIENRLLNC